MKRWAKLPLVFRTLLIDMKRWANLPLVLRVIIYDLAVDPRLELFLRNGFGQSAMHQARILPSNAWEWRYGDYRGGERLCIQHKIAKDDGTYPQFWYVLDRKWWGRFIFDDADPEILPQCFAELRADMKLLCDDAFKKCQPPSS